MSKIIYNVINDDDCITWSLASVIIYGLIINYHTFKVNGK